MRQVDLGHIVVVACGDVCNRGYNVLIVVTADGHCRFFDFTPSEASPDNIGSLKASPNLSNDSKFSPSEETGSCPIIKPCFYQRLPPNIKEALIADVNGDGLNELVVTLTDR